MIESSRNSSVPAAVDGVVGLHGAHAASSSAADSKEPLNGGSPYSVESNAAKYNDIFDCITNRYAAFDQESEIGYAGTNGIVADIGFVSCRDVAQLLMHVRDSPDLLRECLKQSANASLFGKFYLMCNKEQGWNLRLHDFSVRGSGLGGEDSPHYHRWTLASKPMTGGYINVNYRESEVAPHTMPEHVYNKYLLDGTEKQGSSDCRQIQPLGRAAMVPVRYEVFAESPAGGANHFPIREPHSVKTYPRHFGTTITLAHTAKAAKNKSFAFEKGTLESIPQQRYRDAELLKIRLGREITFLQVIQLKDDLMSHLDMRFKDAPNRLTEHECRHLVDGREPNYVETSLLSALEIFRHARAHGEPSREFSPETASFLEEQLRWIDPEALHELTVQNQQDLWQRRLAIDFCLNSEVDRLRKDAGSAVS